MLKELLATLSVIVTPNIFANPDSIGYTVNNMQDQSSLIEADFRNTPVVSIRTQYEDRASYGTGVYIAPNKILTAAHVVKDGDSKYVTIDDKFDVSMDNIELYREHYKGGDLDDLAIITTPKSNPNYYSVVRDEHAKHIRILGYPSISKYLTGYIAKGEIINHSNGLWKSTAFATNGLSGGPMLNDKNEVIGLHVSTVMVKDLNGNEKKFAGSIKFISSQFKWIQENLDK